MESDEDILWKPDVRETKEEVAARAMTLMKWLSTRKEKEIVVVTHSGFLYHTLTAFGNECHPLVKKEISSHFANCELRSMTIVDKGMIGSDEIERHKRLTSHYFEPFMVNTITASVVDWFRILALL